MEKMSLVKGELLTKMRTTLVQFGKQMARQSLLVMTVTAKLCTTVYLIVLSSVNVAEAAAATGAYLVDDGGAAQNYQSDNDDYSSASSQSATLLASLSAAAAAGTAGVDDTAVVGDAAADAGDYQASHYQFSDLYTSDNGEDTPAIAADSSDADAVAASFTGDASRVEAKSSSSGRKSSSKSNAKAIYVPVFAPERPKKKMKIISVDKGFYIPGGTQLFGQFLTLKACMVACGNTPTCFAADYNPWLRKCYQHSNFTACATRRSHPQFVHFSKVPCTIIDAPAGRVTLGASVANGLEQSGIDTITECIKKCVSAGGGVQPTVSVGSANPAEAFLHQACYAIDFDFSTHKCYFFGSNLFNVAIPTTTSGLTQTYLQVYLHCPATAVSNGYQSLNTIPNPNVVHITFCPLPIG